MKGARERGRWFVGIDPELNELLAEHTGSRDVGSLDNLADQAAQVVTRGEHG